MSILFTDIVDLKTYFSGITTDFRVELLESFLNNSMQDVQIVTGKELLEDLISSYEDSNLSSEQEELLPYVRKPLINMAMYRHSMSNSMNIGDNGYTADETETTKRPYQWQMRNFQRQCLRDYSEGMRDLWDFLCENKSNYTGWEETDEAIYIFSKPISFLQDWAKSGRRIADWRTHFTLLTEMGMVWDDLEKVLSTDLWSDLNDEFLTVLSDDNKKLLPYIQRYIAHATIERAAESLPLSIESDGIYIKEVDSNTTNTDTQKQLSDRLSLKKQAAYEADKALCRLNSYLTNNATEDKYSGYYTKFIENATETKLNNDGDKIIIL